MSKKKARNQDVRENRFLEVWRQFRRNKGAMIGLAITIVLIVIAIFADQIWDYKTDVTGINIAERLQGPSLAHPFGTDQFGRDMLARVGYGTRYSLVIGFTSVVTALLLGLPIGAAAGYLGGKFDSIFMRIIDAITIIPSILLTVMLVTVLGTSMFNLMLALSISSIPILARITRASVMTVRNNEYVESARAIGGSSFYIIMTQVLPNCFSPILVQATLRMGTTIISAAGLSYIGLGVPVPTPEWGALLNASKDFIIDKPYLCFFPGLAIMITVMAINLIGDGLRDALDPKLKR
ncbi:MAG: ABC transporter permease [Candidatus Faecousia sp.]|nr:ABC transporter permease [Candidatus Faecousia sp.]